MAASPSGGTDGWRSSSSTPTSGSRRLDPSRQKAKMVVETAERSASRMIGLILEERRERGSRGAAAEKIKALKRFEAMKRAELALKPPPKEKSPSKSPTKMLGGDGTTGASPSAIDRWKSRQQNFHSPSKECKGDALPSIPSATPPPDNKSANPRHNEEIHSRLLDERQAQQIARVDDLHREDSDEDSNDDEPASPDVTALATMHQPALTSASHRLDQLMEVSHVLELEESGSEVVSEMKKWNKHFVRNPVLAPRSFHWHANEVKVWTFFFLALQLFSWAAVDTQIFFSPGFAHNTAADGRVSSSRAKIDQISTTRVCAFSGETGLKQTVAHRHVAAV